MKKVIFILLSLLMSFSSMAGDKYLMTVEDKTLGNWLQRIIKKEDAKANLVMDFNYRVIDVDGFNNILLLKNAENLDKVYKKLVEAFNNKIEFHTVFDSYVNKFYIIEVYSDKTYVVKRVDF